MIRSRLRWLLVLVLSLGCAGVQAREAVEQAAADPVEPAVEAATVAWLELSEPLREGPVPFAFIGEDEAGPSLRAVLEQINGVAEDEAMLGLVVWLDTPGLTVTQSAAVASALERVSDAGKKVAVFAESMQLRDYLLATAADEIWLLQRGDLMLSGIGMEEMYLADMLAKVGVSADFVQVGQFKGADEQLTRAGPSAAWSANIDALLDGLYGQMIGAAAERRGMSVGALEGAMAGSWGMDDDALIEAGLVDRTVRRDLTDATAALFGDDFTWRSLGSDEGGPSAPTNPMALLSSLFQPPAAEPRGPVVAVIHATGPIMSGESGVDDGLFSTASIGSRTLADELSEASADPAVGAIVLRIDSPGGSALASEVIWQAVREAAEYQPVVVSIGEMAASGGYYIASAGDEIVTEPEAIIGSVGVVGGKLVLADLYDMIGLNVTQRTRGPNAAMFSTLSGFSDDERALVRQSMERVYAQFLERIREGRGDRLPDVDAVDEGLLFTGEQAVALGMIDRVGSLADAVELAADLAGLEEGAYGVRDLPRPRTLQEFFSEAFAVSAPGQLRAAGSPLDRLAPALAAAEVLLGEAGVRQLRRSLAGLALMREEPVLLLHPAVLVVR